MFCEIYKISTGLTFVVKMVTTPFALGKFERYGEKEPCNLVSRNNSSEHSTIFNPSLLSQFLPTFFEIFSALIIAEGYKPINELLEALT